MVYISDISSAAPTDARGSLETRVYEVLNELQIPFTRVDNDSVESMEECVEISNKLGAEIRKSVFVCDRKKTKFYLVIMPADKSFNTKQFCAALACPRVSFASAELMQEQLGVLPGTATVMSLLNDRQKNVTVVVDKAVADDEWFACNPGANTTHIRIKTEQLLKVFIPYTGHQPIIAEL